MYIVFLFCQKNNNLGDILKNYLTFLPIPFTIWEGDKDVVLK